MVLNIFSRMIGTNTRTSIKMGNSESKENRTWQNNALPMSETAIQDSTITSTEENKSSNRNGLESSISMDAVPVSSTESGFESVQPSDSSSKLAIAERVNKMIDKKFEPFKCDISESNEELKKKIFHYQNYMDFELSFGYQDAMILYHDADEEEVIKFCATIEKNIILNDKQKPKIALYSRIANSCGGLFKALEFGLERCTFVMFYVTANFVNDKWSEFSSETCLMEAITNPKKRWCVVPIFSHDKSSTPYKIPLSINTLKGVRHLPEEEDFYLVSMATLFNDRISVRTIHEKEHLKKQIKWVRDLEESAREEALEQLKMENEQKKKHAELLKLVEQHKDGSENQSKCCKEKMLNEFVESSKPDELFLGKNNGQLKQPSENVLSKLAISRVDEERDTSSGTSVDPDDLVSDTPSPVRDISAPLLRKETLEQCAPAASSCCRPPPVSNVALSGCPQRSSSNQTCPGAASEDIACKNDRPAGTLPTRSQSALHNSASSESSPSVQRTAKSRSVGGKKKTYAGVLTNCIDHPLSEKSDTRTEVHHHHYYSEPPVYNIKAQNVQIGSQNKLYNNSQGDDPEYYYEEESSYEKSTKDEDYSNSSDESEEQNEPKTSSNSFVSTPSQDGFSNTGSQQIDNPEKTVLQKYGINPCKPVSNKNINDQDQTSLKEVATSGYYTDEGSENTSLKEP